MGQNMLTTAWTITYNIPVGNIFPTILLIRGWIMFSLIDMGKECKRLRRSKHITQMQLSKIIGYGDKTISAFECGRCNNIIILSWYIQNGLDIIKAFGGVIDGKK